MPSPEQLAGPTGAIVLLVAIVGALIGVILAFVRDHLRADREDRQQRDDNALLARDAVDGLKRLAAVEERRERREAARDAKRKSRAGDVL